MPDDQVRFRATMKDDVSKTLGSMNKSFDVLGVKTAGAGKALGKLSASTGGLVTPTNLAAGAGLALAGVLGMSLQKAEAEQIGIQRLGASLKANIPNWDGNTAAIEKQIRASEDLSAFSDGDLRQSLGSLVGVTHDVQEAFKLQSTAMDLARFKGISLQEATVALTKIEGGSYRALKELIGATDDIKSPMQAVAAVTKVAAGQMQAFADSAAGKQASAKNALDDLEETIGGLLLKDVAQLADLTHAAARGLDDLAGAATDANSPTAKLASDGIDLLTTSLIGLPKAIDKVGWDIRNGLDVAFDDLIFHSGAASESVGVKLNDALKQNTGTLADYRDHVIYADSATAKLKDTTNHTANYVETAWSQMTATIVTDVQKWRTEMGLTKTEVQSDIKGITDYTKDRMTTKELRDIISGKGSIGRQIAKGIHDARPDVAQKWKDLLAEFTGLYNARVDVTVKVHGRGKSNDKGKAEGGPVYAGQTYTVGEKGPETLVMGSSSGTIIPNGGWMGGGETVHNVNVFLDGHQVYKAVERHAVRQIRTSPSLTQ